MSENPINPKLDTYLIGLPTDSFRELRETYEDFESHAPVDRPPFVRCLSASQRYDVLRICHTTQTCGVGSDAYFDQIAQRRAERTAATQGGAAAALESLASMPRRR